MLTDHLEAIGPQVAGKVFLQHGIREAVEDNAGVMAAELGAAKVLLAPLGADADEVEAITDRIHASGCEVEILKTPIEEIIVGDDPRLCDVAFTDDALFRLEDPYRLLCGLRQITRERLIVSTCVVPSRAPDGQGDWPIPPGFQAFSGDLSREELSALSTAFAALGLPIDGFRRAERPLLDPETGFAVNPTLWRWFWTEKTLTSALSSTGFEILDFRYIWEKIGILIECE